MTRHADSSDTALFQLRCGDRFYLSGKGARVQLGASRRLVARFPFMATGNALPRGAQCAAGAIRFENGAMVLERWLSVGEADFEATAFFFAIAGAGAGGLFWLQCPLIRSLQEIPELSAFVAKVLAGSMDVGKCVCSFRRCAIGKPKKRQVAALGGGQRRREGGGRKG